jgi:hypothetical protein
MVIDFNLTDQFKRWVAVSPLEPEECWVWMGAKTPFGYGRISYSRGAKHFTIYAHRISYILHNGPIPENHLVCHHCDNPWCVNPKHLYVGTHQDNANDRERRQRSNRQPRKNIPIANHKIRKLTPEQAAEIRRLRHQEKKSYTTIGRLFGITRTAVWQIANYVTYKDTKETK